MEEKQNQNQTTPEEKVDQEIETKQKLDQKINEQANDIQALKTALEQQRKATMMLDETMRSVAEQNQTKNQQDIEWEPVVWTRIKKFVNR